MDELGAGRVAIHVVAVDSGARLLAVKVEDGLDQAGVRAESRVSRRTQAGCLGGRAGAVVFEEEGMGVKHCKHEIALLPESPLASVVGALGIFMSKYIPRVVPRAAWEVLLFKRQNKNARKDGVSHGKK